MVILDFILLLVLSQLLSVFEWELVTVVEKVGSSLGSVGSSLGCRVVNPGEGELDF